VSFSDDIKRFKAKAELAAANVFRGTALDIFGRIVKRTPVGKPSEWKKPNSAPAGYTGGRLRANWQVEFNHAPTGVIDSTTPTGEDKKIQDTDLKTKEALKDKLQSMQFQAMFKDPFVQGQGGGLQTTTRTPVLNYWNNSWSL